MRNTLKASAGLREAGPMRNLQQVCVLSLVEQARRLARAAVHRAHSPNSGQSVFFFPTHPHLDIYGGERVLYTRSDSFSCVEHEKILPNLRLDELTSISKPHGC